MSKELYGYINLDYINTMENIYNSFNADKLSSEELKRCYEIAKSIYSYVVNNDDPCNYYHNTSHEKALDGAINSLYSLGNGKIVKRASSILNSINREITTEENPAFLEIFSSLEYDSSTGFYKLPKKMYLPCKVCDYSSFFVTHELAHGLKDKNSLENKYIKTLEEVVPILVELITAYENNDIYLFKKVCSVRLNMMFNNSCNFIDAFNHYKNSNGEEKKLYRFALEENACYLNSFYYVMAIFNKYLDNNELVISLINDVLLGNITTKDLINVLNLDYSYEYEVGLNKIKRAM